MLFLKFRRRAKLMPFPGVERYYGRSNVPLYSIPTHAPCDVKGSRGQTTCGKLRLLT